MIRLARKHQIDLHAGHRCHQKRRLDRFIRYKIRRLNVNALFCLVDQPQVIVPDTLELGVRSAGNDLHFDIAGFFFRQDEILRIFKQILSRCIVPVLNIAQQKSTDCAAADSQMGIPPVPELRIQSDILFADIKAADISHFPVDDCNFSVISVVYTQMQSAKQSREKDRNMDALLFHFFPKVLSNAPTAHRIIQDPNFYTLCRFFQQCLPNPLEEHVIFYDVIL